MEYHENDIIKIEECHNILYADCSLEHCSPEFIRLLNSKLNIKNTYCIVAYQNELEIYSNIAECIRHDDAKRGVFDENQLLESKGYKAIDDSVLKVISPYYYELILIQQRHRFDRRFRLSNNTGDNANLILDNLFYWNNFLINNNIGYVILSDVPHMGYDNIIYYLCIHYKIPIIMSRHTQIPNRHVLINNLSELDTIIRDKIYEYHKDDYVYNSSKLRLSEEFEQYYDSYRERMNNNVPPSYVINDPVRQKQMQWFGGYGLGYIIYSAFKYSNIDPQLGYVRAIRLATGRKKELVSNLIKEISGAKYIKRLVYDTRRLHNRYDDLAVSPDYQQKYIYFAMHYQPEASSAPLGGGEYANQVIPLKILSNALPEDMKIYVKIHPQQFEAICGYEEMVRISNIPKVILIKESASSFELSDKALAVATFTGNVALEAQFRKKPVLMFGYSILTSAPYSIKVRTVDDCRNAIATIINGDIRPSEDELRIFFKAWEEVSYNNDDNEERSDRIFDMIKQKGLL